MKKVLVLLIIITTNYSFGKNTSRESKMICEQILTTGVYYGYVEEFCNLKGTELGDKLLIMYDKSGCRLIVSQKTVDETIKIAVYGLDIEKKNMGQSKFCHIKRADYYDVLSTLKKQ